MDSDQAEEEPERAYRARRLAELNGILLIWQRPCHEALLLRHMPGCSNRKPPSCSVAHRALKKVWPEYEKPMPRAQLSARIVIGAIQQAAGVEPELRAFLIAIGLLP